MSAILNYKKLDLNKLEKIFQKELISLKEILPGIFGMVSSSKNILEKKTMAWKFFLKLSKEALEGFVEKKLSLFDAIVGESRCELRAFYFLNLMNEYNQNSDLHKTIQKTLKKIELLNREISFSFIENNKNFDLKVSKEIAFLIFCFILTIVREDCLEYHIHKTNEKKLMNRYNERTPYNFARILVNKSKKFVSKESIDFLQKQANKSSPHLSHYVKYLQDSYILTDHYELKCAPAFFGMKIILDRLHFSDCILSIKINFQKKSQLIRQENLFIKFNSSLEKIDFISKQELLQIDRKTPIYTIEGCSVMRIADKEEDFISNRMQLIQSIDISDIILPSFIHKSMYSSIYKDTKLNIEEKDILLETIRLKSLPGRSIQDPSVFSISHICCLSLDEVLLSVEVKSPNYLPKIKKQAQTS